MDITNYRKLSIDECKQISFNILCSVADFCESNNIRYYLACGTLLGAIRHNGYIPWDDDIDIMMPRPDYNRFIKEYNNERYKVLEPKEGMYFFVKVYDKNTMNIFRGIDYKKYKPIGVDIDIFPLDGIINDDDIIKKLKKRNDVLEMLLSLSKQPILYKGIFKSINRIIARVIGSKRIIRLIEKNCQTYDYEKSEYVIRFKNTLNGFTGAIHKSAYDIDRKKFENREFNIPKGYELWLNRFYGNNYMELPPIEKRRVHNRESYILSSSSL